MPKRSPLDMARAATSDARGAADLLRGATEDLTARLSKLYTGVVHDVMRAMGLKDLDTTLIRTPVIGAIYEAWFRKESYYRVDTRLMYLEIVSGVVKRLAEDATAAKGLGNRWCLELARGKNSDRMRR